MLNQDLPSPWVWALPFRQLQLPDWGSHYQPAMKATRGQAPSSSRASLLQCRDFGRLVHCHSPGEQEAVFLALHHPALFYLKEQQPLSSLTEPHPLQSHPLARGRTLPAVEGTVSISMSLGLFAFHRKQWDRDATGAPQWRPLPWIGDLLLFLLDVDGPYCVHWDVKGRRGDHAKPGPGNGLRPRSRRSEMRARARYDVQREYFKIAGIRLVEVAREEIDRQLANNLRTLFGWTGRQVTMPLEEQTYLTDALTRALESGLPPIEVIYAAKQHLNASVEECKRLFYQLIWRRQLRVDLFQPVLIDCPLCPESRDALEVYRPWYAR